MQETEVDDDHVRALAQCLLQHLHGFRVEIAIGEVEGIRLHALEHVMIEVHVAGREIPALIRLGVELLDTRVLGVVDPQAHGQKFKVFRADVLRHQLYGAEYVVAPLGSLVGRQAKASLAEIQHKAVRQRSLHSADDVGRP